MSGVQFPSKPLYEHGLDQKDNETSVPENSLFGSACFDVDPLPLFSSVGGGLELRKRASERVRVRWNGTSMRVYKEVTHV